MQFRIAAFMRGFWSGLGSISFASGPSYIEPVRFDVTKRHRSIEDAAEAMRSDWSQVGDDLRAALAAVAMSESDVT